jgi:hypothetical protein
LSYFVFIKYKKKREKRLQYQLFKREDGKKGRREEESEEEKRKWELGMGIYIYK